MIVLSNFKKKAEFFSKSCGLFRKPELCFLGAYYKTVRLTLNQVFLFLFNKTWFLLDPQKVTMGILYKLILGLMSLTSATWVSKKKIHILTALIEKKIALKSTENIALLKVSKSQKQSMGSWILPRNERWISTCKITTSRLVQKESLCSFCKKIDSLLY